jgi:hypothetical protein
MLAHLYGAVSSRDSAGSVERRTTQSHPLRRLLSGLTSRRLDIAVLALMDVAWRLGNISQSLKLRLRRAGEGPAANLKHASGKDLAHAD